MRSMLAAVAFLSTIPAYAADAPTFTIDEAKALYQLGAATTALQMSQAAAKTAVDKLNAAAPKPPAEPPLTPEQRAHPAKP